MEKVNDGAGAPRITEGAPVDRAAKVSGIISDLEKILAALEALELSMTVALLDQAIAEAKHELTILS